MLLYISYMYMSGISYTFCLFLVVEEPSDSPLKYFHTILTIKMFTLI